MLARIKEFLKGDVKEIIFTFKYLTVLLYLKEIFVSEPYQAGLSELLGFFYPLYPLMMSLTFIVVFAIAHVITHTLLFWSGIIDK